MSSFNPVRLGLLALPLPLLVWWQYHLLAADIAGYKEETGVIVGYVEVPRTAGDAQTTYRYIVEYKGVGNAKQRVVTDVARSFPKGIGESVAVLVEPVRRTSAYVADAFDYWFSFTVNALIALAFFFFLAVLPIGLSVLESRSRLKRSRQRRRARTIKNHV